MKSKLFGVFGAVVLVLMLVVASLPLATPADAAEPMMPIIFVHGGAGSGAQFESQAMRFTSNGYPQNLIFVHEYDSSFATESTATVYARLDALIATIKAQTGATQVYILGHSLGTTMVVGYLTGRPDRQANVAKYVAIDGSNAATPGGIPTLAIWSGLRVSMPVLPGGTNVSIPNQPHVEVATSAEAFVEMYKFFTGNTPETNQILPETPGQVKLSGRAVFYPWNSGTPGATLQIWEINSDTGARIGRQPQATYSIGASGDWGPFSANGLKHYEFNLLRPGFREHHFYFAPYIRSSHLVRLNTSPPGGVGDMMERDGKSSALVITRNKEWWGNRGAENDILTIDGVNIVNATTCPQPKPPTGAPNFGVIGIFAYDRYLNGLTDLSAPIPYFYGLTFMTGVDIYIPAAEPPNGTISLVLTPRGGGGKTQTINILNWASLGHGVSIPFNDYFQPEAPVLVKPSAPPAAPRVSPRSPASMSVQYMNINPQQVYGNQPVTISTYVVNTGGEAGSLNVVLKINGNVEQTKPVSVGPQGTQPVKFTVTKAQSGTYTVDIGGQKGSFTILGAGSSTAGTSSSDRMIGILIIIGALVLATVLVVWLLIRRPA